MKELPEKDIEDAISLFDYALVLAKRMRLILGITITAAILSIILSLILPEIYEGTAKVLPPQQGNKSLSAALMSQIPAGLGMLAGIPSGTGSPSDYYASLLGSRTIADAIIDRFGLKELYEAETPTDARESLSKAFSAAIDKKSPIITIRVKDKDPKRAADMANAFVEELAKLDNKFAVADASQRRLFFEDQLKVAHADLARAEEALRSFQETTGAIKIDSQAGTVLEGIATLRAQIAAKEIQIKVMNTYATPYNREVKQAEEELSGMREQLKKLEAKGENYQVDTVIATDQIPMLATEYLRKTREFKYHETLFELLAKQFESARLDEANTMSTIQVVDSAVVPDIRISPKRTSMVVIATMLGLFFAVIAAFFVERWQTVSEDPEHREKMAKMKEYLTPIKSLFALGKVGAMFRRKSDTSSTTPGAE